nr:formate dehydrogenase [Rhodoferax sp.]
MSQSTTKLSRRTLFAGAGTVGAMAAVASLLPSVRGLAAPAGQMPRPTPEKGGGYSLSAHVKKYYQTTLI